MITAPALSGDEDYLPWEEEEEAEESGSTFAAAT